MNTRTILLFLICINILSCSATHQTSETKNGTSLNTNAPIFKKELMSTGTYNVTIDPDTDYIAITCTGSGIKLNLYSDQSISISGTATCKTGWLGIPVMDIDLGESFQTSNLKEDASTPDVDKMKGIISRAKNIALDSSGNLPVGGYVFTPARPNILNPLTNIKNLESMEEAYKENSSVTVRTSDGRTIKDIGIFGVNYLGSSTSSPSGTSKIDTQKGNKIIHSKISVEGFNNIPQKGNFMLFKSREMWMGTAPVAIYKMVIKSTLNDVSKGVADKWWKAVPTNDGQKDVVITFNLVSFEPVINNNDDEDDENEEEDEEDEDNDE